MAGLQRSAVSFRRQGSSGLVWDDRFLSGELNQVGQSRQEQEHEHGQEQQDNKMMEIKLERDVKPPRSINTIERSRSNGGQRGYRTGKVSPAIEPPSPKVAACGFCSGFGKQPNPHRKKAAKGRSR